MKKVICKLNAQINTYVRITVAEHLLKPVFIIISSLSANNIFLSSKKMIVINHIRRQNMKSLIYVRLEVSLMECFMYSIYFSIRVYVACQYYDYVEMDRYFMVLFT